MRAESLLSLAATVAGEHRKQDVLDAIVRGLVGEPGVVRARIWLLSPGDLCDVCFFRSECADHAQCLHLVATAEGSIDSAPEDWSSIEGRFRRIPLNGATIGSIGATGNPILIKDRMPDQEWIAPEPLQREGIRGFAGQPLVFRGKILGVLAVFCREPLDEQDFRWLRMFAGQAAVAIANAQAFEDLVLAEAALRVHARHVQQIIDFVPQHMFVLAPGEPFRGNVAAREYFGTMEAATPEEHFVQVTHPDDLEKVLDRYRGAIAAGVPAQGEARVRRKDGVYRWFLQQVYPLRDDDGRIVHWCGVRIDIDDQKQAQERTQRENIALREEVDKIAMFEEIVGTSPALQAVLARVAKVARTESTVLITGETGTGKELVARAIHKRSPRANRAFVSVNCAAIPRDLIASELFGHEKGAFTGALQRRLGRFELAEGGTIFLDEIGELPAETQIALLRVLQEREFQRVGSNLSIRADVRVIAATHRDLPAAIADGAFRSDLFYRINVFPIEIPPLRERREDIRLLVEYFIERYSSKAGKQIRHIDKKSLERLQFYPWPGNIRELQNVIERSVIVCDTEEFSVDESWLSREAREIRPLSNELEDHEREIIEAALAETGGRVSGRSGAAAKLGMAPSTLDSKIKTLKIDKRRFQTA